jgi:phosphoglycolate phosphatase-like HAD superfamily hydrolase
VLFGDRIETVVSDLDDTLLDHRRSVIGGLRRWLPTLGLAASDSFSATWFVAGERHVGDGGWPASAPPSSPTACRPAEPHPAAFEAATTALGAGPRTTMHVGDSHPVDYQGACAAGRQAVLLIRDGAEPPVTGGPTGTRPTPPWPISPPG